MSIVVQSAAVLYANNELVKNETEYISSSALKIDRTLC